MTVGAVTYSSVFLGMITWDAEFTLHLASSAFLLQCCYNVHQAHSCCNVATMYSSDFQFQALLAACAVCLLLFIFVWYVLQYISQSWHHHVRLQMADFLYSLRQRALNVVY